MSADRITVCQLQGTLWVAGGQILAARLARRLSDLYRVLFVCLEELGPLGSQLRDQGFPVYVLGRQPGLDWRTLRGLAEVIRKEKVGLVHAHARGPFLHAALARLPYRAPPVLFTEHSAFHIEKPRPHRMLANRFLLRRGDGVVGVSQTVADALVTNEGFASDRVELVYNGIDPVPFLDARREREFVRAELGLDPNHFVVIQVSRLAPEKDHATAIRALAQVVRQRDDVRFLIVGVGEEEERIEALIRHHGLDPHVRCLGLRSDVARLLGAADLALLATNTEGCPLVIAEAMAAGLPVVASDVGGVPEVMTDGETGFLVPAGDDARMAEQILRLAGDPALRQNMGQAGRQRALAHFSEDRMVANYRRIYRELLDRVPISDVTQ